MGEPGFEHSVSRVLVHIPKASSCLRTLCCPRVTLGSQAPMAPCPLVPFFRPPLVCIWFSPSFQATAGLSRLCWGPDLPGCLPCPPPFSGQ